MIYLILRAGALALACRAAPLAAQTATSVRAPAGWAPIQAPCVQQGDGSCTPVSASNPLPISGGAGGGTPTGTAGSPSSSVVTVQGISGGTTLPVSTGALVRNADPTLTAGQRADMGMLSSGALLTAIGTPSTFAAVLSPNDNNGAQNGMVAVSRGQVFDPISGTWPRQRGDTNGTFIVNKGGSNLATAQVSVGTSATLLAAARSGRQKVTASVGAANACAFGTSSVTSANGFALQPTAGASLTLDYAGALYAVCSGTTTISVMEQF